MAVKFSLQKSQVSSALAAYGQKWACRAHAFGAENQLSSIFTFIFFRRSCASIIPSRSQTSSQQVCDRDRRVDTGLNAAACLSMHRIYELCELQRTKLKPGFHSNAIACVGKQPIMVVTASTDSVVPYVTKSSSRRIFLLKLIFLLLLVHLGTK